MQIGRVGGQKAASRSTWLSVPLCGTERQADYGTLELQAAVLVEKEEVSVYGKTPETVEKDVRPMV